MSVCSLSLSRPPTVERRENIDMLTKGMPMPANRLKRSRSWPLAVERKERDLTMTNEQLPD